MESFDYEDATTNRKPPLVNDHCLLPLPRGKYAPRTLMLKGQQHELKNFLGVYEHLCAHYRITSSDEKCKGLITYCSPKVGRTVERFPSFIMGDYDQLVEDLEYFQEEEEDTYNVGLMAAFTKKWRKRKMETKKIFKQYHRKYLELVGKALASGHISNEDNNRHFWEGIHRSLRKRIEDRMLVVDPDLDVSTPFDMQKVVKAVGHIYNRHRFDQHLLETSVSYSSASESDTEEEDHYKPPKKSTFDSDSEKEESEDSDYSPRKPLHKQRRRHSADRKNITLKKEPLPKQDLVPKKVDNHELSKLAQQMGKLSLTDTRYRALYVDIIREMLDKPQSPAFAQPVMENQYQRSPPRNYNQPRNHENQFQREGPPRNYNPPPNNNPYQRDGPPRQYNPPRNNDNRFQRDTPPHQNMPPPQSYGPPQGQSPRTELFCFGCGKTGHRMPQCGELNGLLNQRIVVRNDWGRLQWPDGSPIRKDREDTWVQAIGKAVKRTNIVQAEVYSSDDEEVHHYVGVVREEEDASSEDQEELGWTSLSSDSHPLLEPRVIGDCYAVGAERTPRISKDTRKQVQFLPPGKMQGMKNLPQRGDAVSYKRQRPIINHGVNSNRYQPGNPIGITPLDVHQGKFEAKVDNQLLPMDVDKEPIEKLGEETKKIPTNPRRSETLKIPNPRTKTGRTSSEIVQDIMKMPLTITVEEAVNISRSVQRDLTSASKPMREAYPQTPEKMEKVEKNALGANVSQSLIRENNRYPLGEPRDDLLIVEARVGRVTMPAVFDSGSQVNVLSEKWMKVCGLPVSTEGVERYRITGVNGGLARCVGMIPNAKIYLTDNDLVTIGDLIVVEHSGFDLLLGRPWATMNGAGLREAKEGTYINFLSQGKPFEVNACPNPSYEEKESLEVATLARKTNGRKEKIYTLSVRRHSNESDVPDSEEEHVPDLTDRSVQMDEESTPPHQPEWFSRESNDGDDEFEARRPTDGLDEEEDEEGRRWPPKSPSPGNNISEAHSKNRSIIIESRVQENFIKMIKKGIDEDTWNKFCRAEKRRRKQDRDQWQEWTQEKDEMQLPSEASNVEEMEEEDPLEPSATLATPEPEPMRRTAPPKKRDRDPEPESVIVAARRSKRVRKESRKARESEDWQKWRRQVYEREEKRVQKRITHYAREPSGSTTSSFGAKISLLVPKREPKKVISKQPKKRVKPSIPNNTGKTARPVMVMDGGPPFAMYDRETNYSWISKGEMVVIYEKLKHLPGSRGKTFFIHRETPTVVGVNMVVRINEEQFPLQRTRKDRRVLSVVIGMTGTLTVITGHEMDCVGRTLNLFPSTCTCSKIGTQYHIDIPTQIQMIAEENAPETSDEEEPTTAVVSYGAKLSILPPPGACERHKQGWMRKQGKKSRTLGEVLTPNQTTFIMDGESRSERPSPRKRPPQSIEGREELPDGEIHRFWMDREEMRQIKEWTKNLPGSRGKTFFIYPLGEDRIAVHLTSIGGTLEQLKQRENQRVIEVWRRKEGELTWKTWHTIACATKALGANKEKCDCMKNPKKLGLRNERGRPRPTKDLKWRFRHSDKAEETESGKITGEPGEEIRTLPRRERLDECNGCPESRNLTAVVVPIVSSNLINGIPGCVTWTGKLIRGGTHLVQ